MSLVLVGGDFVLPAASWLLLGCPEANCRCRGELIQGKGEGRLGAGLDAGRGIPYI